MKVATVSIFAAAAIGSSVAIKGSTPPSHTPQQAEPTHAQADQQATRP
jgi:hypothetical protein